MARRARRVAGFFAVALGLLAPPAPAREYRTLDVVGDSVSAGVNPDAYAAVQVYGWAHMLYGVTGFAAPPPQWAITNLWPNITRFNSAVSGSKAWEWADTNGYPYLAAVLSHQPDLVLVMIGGNDFLAYAADGAITPQEQAQYDASLRFIIARLRQLSPAPDIVVLGYYDLCDGFSNHPLVPAQYRLLSPATAEGNRLIRSIAESNGCFFADTAGAFLHHAYGAELGDTNHLAPDYVRTPLSALDIHPVTAGHRSLCEQAYGALARLREMPTLAGIECAPGAAAIRWTAGFGQTCRVERAASLTAPHAFAPLGTNVGVPPLNVWTDACGAAAAGFYRIRAGP